MQTVVEPFEQPQWSVNMTQADPGVLSAAAHSASVLQAMHTRSADPQKLAPPVVPKQLQEPPWHLDSDPVAQMFLAAVHRPTLCARHRLRLHTLEQHSPPFVQRFPTSTQPKWVAPTGANPSVVISVAKLAPATPVSNRRREGAAAVRERVKASKRSASIGDPPESRVTSDRASRSKSALSIRSSGITRDGECGCSVVRRAQRYTRLRKGALAAAYQRCSSSHRATHANQTMPMTANVMPKASATGRGRAVGRRTIASRG
jgi:hypothetical protein